MKKRVFINLFIHLPIRRIVEEIEDLLLPSIYYFLQFVKSILVEYTILVVSLESTNVPSEQIARGRPNRQQTTHRTLHRLKRVKTHERMDLLHMLTQTNATHSLQLAHNGA